MVEMGYVSTRGAYAVPFSQAISSGLAPDRGLYVPERWPHYASREAPSEFARTAEQVIRPFLAGDALERDVAAITGEAFNFPVPLAPLGADAHVLELFHGPTAAFKDFGARFLAASMARISRENDKPLHIVVATSGDTGGAVAAAFHKRPGIRVSVLYPKGLVSPAQERQLTCWGGNVTAFAVRGAFDDCQRIVKEAFADAAIQERFRLSTANSINVGRLLPQMSYFAAASLAIWNTYGAPASFVVPSGNLGHATACAWARRIGLPIDEIVLAHNANRTMPDYFETGEWRPRPTVHTIASAMDVGDPSNAERLRHLFPDLAGLREAFSAYVIDDEAIRARIRSDFDSFGQVWCPHTAAAAEAHARHTPRGKGRWVVVSTAHAAKFPEIVEPIIGRPVAPPPSLAALAGAAPAAEIDPTFAAFNAALRD